MACVPLGCFRCSALAAVEAEAVGVAAAISDADGISGGRVDGDDGESDDDDDAANDDEEGDDEEFVAFVEGGGGERMAGSPGGEGGSVMALVVAVADAVIIDDETAASPSCCSMPTLEDDEVDWSIISALFGKLESNPQEWRWMGSPTPITATSMNYCLILGVGGGGTKAEGED